MVNGIGSTKSGHSGYVHIARIQVRLTWTAAHIVVSCGGIGMVWMLKTSFANGYSLKM